MQRSSSDSLTPIDLLIQLKGQDAQNHSDENQNNVKTDISEIFQNKGNLSAEQKDALSQFFLKSVLPLFQNTAGPEHEKSIY